MSYSQIIKKIKVSKSSLSLWLRIYPLSQDQISKLRNQNERRIEKYRKTMKQKRENKLRNYYLEEKKKLLPLLKKEIYLSGLFLYWGEGNKAARHVLSVNNTDPAVMKFYLYWLIKALGVKKDKIHIYLHLYKDMDKEMEIDYWVKELSLSKNNVSSIYIKESKKTEIDQKGFGHGTCALVVHNTVLKDRVILGLKAISDRYQKELLKI